jgi:hypothetical protein
MRVSRTNGNSILEDNTMKSKKDWLRISVFTVAVGIILAACPQPTDSDSTDIDPTYAVWTDYVAYTEFQAAFDVATLQDDHYVRIEITDAKFNQMSPPNEYKQNWTKNRIYDWFIGRGFGYDEANRETAWLITINHGFIASRSGNIVYIIIK